MVKRMEVYGPAHLGAAGVPSVCGACPTRETIRRGYESLRRPVVGARRAAYAHEVRRKQLEQSLLPNRLTNPA